MAAGSVRILKAPLTQVFQIDDRVSDATNFEHSVYITLRKGSVGSANEIKTLHVEADIDSGTQSEDLRAIHAMCSISGSAVSSGAGGNGLRAGHFAAASDSTGTTVEMNGLTGFCAAGFQGSSVNVGAITTASGIRGQCGFSTSGSGSFGDAYAIWARSPNGTGAGRSITNAYGLFSSNQRQSGVTNGWGIKTNGGKNEFTDEMTLNEQSFTPASPAAGTQLNFYMKADKFIIQFDDGGTVRYKYLDLTGTGVTWTHTTTAP